MWGTRYKINAIFRPSCSIMIYSVSDLLLFRPIEASPLAVLFQLERVESNRTRTFQYIISCGRSRDTYI